ncbi:hypothetical protein V493_03793 [Pseudogymnoascus sp. VKM F-4281 (FW-2241)]|nr:hypothetical protein V493_03793 [Pseudogymnoascus sp. VKM F-4281 (FW-2241)]
MATDLNDGTASLSLTSPPGPDDLSPLEQDVLEDMQLASLLDGLAGAPTAEILDGLLQLERKTSLVFTLLKASVYSIVLQQEIYSGDQGAGQDQ